jgi:hypothetical protein
MVHVLRTSDRTTPQAQPKHSITITTIQVPDPRQNHATRPPTDSCHLRSDLAVTKATLAQREADIQRLEVENGTATFNFATSIQLLLLYARFLSSHPQLLRSIIIYHSAITTQF